MSPTDFTAIITVFMTMLGVMGAGARWLISSVDSRNAKAAAEQSTARDAFSKRLQDEILMLRTDIQHLQAKELLYTRRNYMLEDLIRKIPGATIPDVSWWPPPIPGELPTARL